MIKRVLISLIPLGVVVGLLVGDILFAQQYGLILLCSICAAGSVYEIIDMYEEDLFFSPSVSALITGITVIWCALYLSDSYPLSQRMFCWDCLQEPLFSVSMIGAPLTITLLAHVSLGLQGQKTRDFQQVLLAGSCSLLLAILFSSVFLVFTMAPDPWTGYWFLLFVFVNNKASDSGAYFAGKYLGKTSFAANVSPKKTWEGFAGSVVVGLLVGFLFAVYSAVGETMGLSRTMLFSLILTVAGALGDLLGSMIKRGARADDSSELFPRIGGFLDMTDCFLVSMPISIILFSEWLLQ